MGGGSSRATVDANNLHGLPVIVTRRRKSQLAEDASPAQLEVHILERCLPPRPPPGRDPRARRTPRPAGGPADLLKLRPSLALPPPGTAAHHAHMLRVLSSPDDLDAFAAFLLRGFAAEPLQFYLALDAFARDQLPAGADPQLVARRHRRRSSLAGGAAAAAPPATVRVATPRAAAAAAGLFAEFLALDAPSAVHVAAATRRDVENALDGGRADIDVFRPAVGEVLDGLARDKLRPFVEEQRASRLAWLRALKALGALRAGEHRLGAPPRERTRGNSVVREPSAALVSSFAGDLRAVLRNAVDRRRGSDAAKRRGAMCWVDPETAARQA